MGSAAAALSPPSQRTSPPRRQTRLRGLPVSSVAPGQGKRRRDPRDDDEEDGDTNRPPKRAKNNDRTVSFGEVYGNGHPEYRHAIVEYPPTSGDWFIIRCDECGLHFKRNALQGGAKHLNGQKHGRLPKTHVLAVEELGFRVLGCDKDKAKRNNDAFDRAVRAGYVPRKGHTDQAHRQSPGEVELSDEDPGQPFETNKQQRTNTTVQGRHQRGKPFEGITDPTVGRMYRAWYRGKGFYVALMLPLGNFGTVGVVGGISNIDRQRKAPKCYRRSGARILGWASGYEDGGPKSRERMFPMLYFEDTRDLAFEGSLVVPPSLGWVAAKDLRPFDVDDPECRRTNGFRNSQLLERARMSSTTTGNISAGGESDKDSG